MSETGRNEQGWQGSKWIRRTTRLAIYLRDGLSCAYCGASIEDGAILTIDHIKPRSKGGSNEPANLVTACKRCNSARGDRPLRRFARSVADYLNHGIEADDIIRHVQTCRRRRLPRAEARELIERRGSVAAVLSYSSTGEE